MKTSTIITLAAVGVGAYLLTRKGTAADSLGTSPLTDYTAAAPVGYLTTTNPNQSGASGTIRDKTYNKTVSFSNAREGVDALNNAWNRGEKIVSGSRTVTSFAPNDIVKVKLASGKTETYKGGTISQLAGQSKPVYIGVRSTKKRLGKT